SETSSPSNASNWCRRRKTNRSSPLSKQWQSGSCGAAVNHGKAAGRPRRRLEVYRLLIDRVAGNAPQNLRGEGRRAWQIGTKEKRVVRHRPLVISHIAR